MTLAQAQLLFQLLLHGPYEVRTAAQTARVCVRRGWVAVVGGLNWCQITADGIAALRTLFPAVVECYERKQRLERAMFAGTYCVRCGSSDTFDPSWRWNGETWEHRCRDLHPQVGHTVVDPIADLRRLRSTLLAMYRGGESLPSSVFHEVMDWSEAEKARDA